MKSPAEFPERVLQTISRYHMICPGDRVLVAVSGGPDSIALLHVLRALAAELRLSGLGVAHFNHHLRDAASDEDAGFVVDLCRDLGLDCRTGGEDVAAYQKGTGLSLEMAARQCRRRFLLNAASAAQAQKIALGHNANDQAEEVLLRLIRGTAPGGLSGMRPTTAEGLIRPLLGLERSEILQYLTDNGFPYRTDISNLEPCCDRNRLRLRVLPRLREHFNPKLVQTLCRHADLAREEEAWWDQALDPLWRRLVISEQTGRIVLQRRLLVSAPEVVGRRLLKRALIRLSGSFYGLQRVHLDLLLRLAVSKRSTGCIHLPGNIRGRNEYDCFSVSVEAVAEHPLVLRIDAPGTFQVAGLTLKVSSSSGNGASGFIPDRGDPFTAWMDEACLRWPLTVRTWEPGDRFQPLGMRGRTKKLQDLFTDLKVPPSLRGRLPILCDVEKICWVVGYRMDERVRIRNETVRILQISVG
ncbi:MAG: tRNA lysidine(34) synthetase TilS [Syntrophobacteraceae bacterium CG2_30_61_12]|nr:MAG: tRNA lysidine(34) synthetase TilS [Syntrophobacteraceae bacterium CG2_30_61_12]